MRVLAVFALLAVGHAAANIEEQIQAMMADPSFQAHAMQMAAPMEAMMADAEQMQTALNDPRVQKQVERVIEPISALMADPKVQEEAKRVAEHLQTVMADRSFQEEAQRMAEPMLAALASDPESLQEQMQTMMADPNFQELANRVVEPLKEMISDEQIKDQAKAAVEQVKDIIADPKFQKEARRITEPMMSMMAEAEQMRDMIADPSLQRIAQPSQERRSLASLLLAANPSLAGVARSPAVAPQSLRRAHIVMGDDIESKVNGIIAIIAKQLGVDADKVILCEQSYLDADINKVSVKKFLADSLDAVKLIMALEEAFDIKIPYEEAEEMALPGDCDEAIKAKLSRAVVKQIKSRGGDQSSAFQKPSFQEAIKAKLSKPSFLMKIEEAVKKKQEAIEAGSAERELQWQAELEKARARFF